MIIPERERERKLNNARGRERESEREQRSNSLLEVITDFPLGEGGRGYE